MLEKYQSALNPASILEVVPRDVLQNLMQGFFFGYRAGMVLIYDEGKNSDGSPVLERLEPVDDKEETAKEWRGKFQNFNPFCAKFRENPTRNTLCEACDLKYAKMEFSGTKKSVECECHMGLTDMTFPIKIGNQVRGVIFGGQKITNEPSRISAIEWHVDQKAPDIAAELKSLLSLNSESSEAVSAFQISFEKFAQAFQRTVEAFVRAKVEEVERDALLEIGEELGRSLMDDPVGWTQPTQGLFAELETFVGRKPVWMLQRRGSRYQCVAASPLGIQSLRANLAVAALIHVPAEVLYLVEQGGPAAKELVAKLGNGALTATLVRCDAAISQTDVSSVVLVFGTRLLPEFERFAAACARALAYPAGVASLFQKLEKQQRDFARAASFTGHHLKTPLQSALFSMRDAAILAEETPIGDEVGEHLREAETQISQGLVDALRLQGAALPPVKERFDFFEMLRDLSNKLVPIARQKGIQIRLHTRPEGSCTVFGVRFHVRVAFSNLLENAIKYSFENKIIEVRVQRISTSGKTHHRNRGMIAVEIEDIGVGFPHEKKADLFSFGTRLDDSSGEWKRTGVGIGLVQAKEYIEAAGGSLDINSEQLSDRSGAISRVTAFIHIPIA